MNIDLLIKGFAHYWPLDEAATEALKKLTVGSSLRKREYVLRAGEECNHFTFVIKGCLKMYNVDIQGTCHNLQFATEGNWITDYGSFYAEKPSELYIQALESAEILQIAKCDIFYLYEHFPIFDRNFRIIIENAFIDQQKRMLLAISASAEEKYLYFLERYPHLHNRISNVQIASYISVTPEFLSTVRKRIAANGIFS